MKLRAATRGSPLALAQTQSVISALVKKSLVKKSPGLEVETLVIQTEGDLRTDTAISEMGGKAVFASALEEAVAAGEADIAVHSAKDLSAVLPPGLVIGAVPERADPRDVLIGVAALDELPENALVGTGAARRKLQLQLLRPDLRFFELRGNIATRLKRLEENAELMAVVVAKAALDRLGLDPRPSLILETSQMLPQVGQGFLAVQYLESRTDLKELLASIDNSEAHQILTAERAFLKELEGDCNIPAAAFAKIQSGEIHMEGILALGIPPGSQMLDQIRDSQIKSAQLQAGTGEAPEDLGRRLARTLMANSP